MKLWFKHHPLVRLEQQRTGMSARASLPSQLLPLLELRFPTVEGDARSVDALVVDFETSGFDPEGDQILSMGWVEIQQGVIRLNSAHHYLISQEADVPSDTVKVHHLLPEVLQSQGLRFDEVFKRLFHAMEGKLLVAHGACIERDFTRQYIKRYFGLDDFPLLWLDTLKIEQYRQQMQTGKKDWRLASVRQNYHLPAYPAHHALMDAVATAELYLAQLNSLFAKNAAPLGVLYKASL